MKRMVRVCVFYSQVPGLGHIPNVVKSMGSTNDAVVKSAVQVVHLLSANEVRHAARRMEDEAVFISNWGS